MDNYIDDEIKRLIVEIITVIILFIIVFPMDYWKKNRM